MLCNTMYGAKYVRPPPLYEGCLKGELQGYFKGTSGGLERYPSERYLKGSSKGTLRGLKGWLKEELEGELKGCLKEDERVLKKNLSGGSHVH